MNVKKVVLVSINHSLENKFAFKAIIYSSGIFHSTGIFKTISSYLVSKLRIQMYNESIKSIISFVFNVLELFFDGV